MEAKNSSTNSETVNVLKAWKRNFDYSSSDLVLPKRTERKYVDSIYYTLLNFFGPDFFEIDTLKLMSENQLHFIHSHLMKASVSSYCYLFETCYLLSYSQTVKPEYYSRMHSERYHSNKMKEVLFEVYIDYLFYSNNVPYRANQKRDNQFVEGYCNILNTEALVECKRKYSISTKELNLKSYVSAELMRIVRKAKWGFECIGTVQFKKPKLTNTDFINAFKKFKNYIVLRTTIEASFKESNNAIELTVTPFDQVRHMELEKGLVVVPLYFTVRALNRMDQNGQFQFRVSVNYNVTFNVDEVVKKTISVIRMARKQHKSDEDKLRILFIDNEFSDDFTAPLLNQNKIYEEKVVEFLNSRKTKDIVVLLFRYYNKKVPQVIVRVLCRDELKPYRDVLLAMNYMLVNLTKLIIG